MIETRPQAVKIVGLFLGLCLLAADAGAQDLEPRAFSPTPTGLNVALLGYSRSAGNVFFDSALLIEDATGTVHGTTAAYLRTFGLAGMSAKISAVVPYAWGDWEGLVDGEQASTSRSGFADSRLQLAVNFVGAPAVPLKDFVSYREGTIVGASVVVVMPTGQYDPDKLINLGGNRWAFRPRLGFSSRISRLTLEAMMDMWFFTTNDDAYGNTTISQAPIWALQVNAIYAFKKGFWMGIGGGMAEGGETTVNGVDKGNLQKNWRLGATLAIPLGVRESIRVFYMNSVRTELGADFDLINVSFQYRWGGGI